MQPSTVSLRSLPPGSRFRLPLSGKTGVVEEHSAASSTVKYDARRETTFVTSAGAAIAFDKPERTNISLETQVVPL